MRFCAAVAAVAALTSACTNAAPVPAPAPVPPPTTTTSAAPTLAELDARAKAALPAPAAFDALGGKYDDATAALDDLPMPLEGQAIGEVCGALLRVDKGTSAARSRSWSGGVYLLERVHVTSEQPAKALVPVVRQQAGVCAPGGEFAVTTPEGVEESFAYCEPNDGAGALPWTCQVALARGNVFALVSISGQSKKALSGQLSFVLPIVAEPFLKA
ncbi:hypothetical protein LFM09_11060 [Lentzea alba]|uniref:hypothetical protein n=1 Tax=Lentzea alba TaxID=2714351 RepID=UPI0039BEEEF4